MTLTIKISLKKFHFFRISSPTVKLESIFVFIVNFGSKKNNCNVRCKNTLYNFWRNCTNIQRNKAWLTNANQNNGMLMFSYQK